MVRQKEILEWLVLVLFCELMMEVWYTLYVSVFIHRWYATIISLTISIIKICRLREGVGIATNNAAEYRAMILGMKYALKKGFTGIRIQGDSKLVCMQVGYFIFFSMLFYSYLIKCLMTSFTYVFVMSLDFVSNCSF